MTFSKYHGLGNDFILFDDPDGQIQSKLTADRIRALCHRWTGIGADGILIRTKGQRGADHHMLLFNADGSPSEISGNGLRCFVLFLRERGYPVDHELAIETGGGLQHARLHDDHTVESTMPAPIFSPPYTGGQGGVKPLELKEKDLTFSVISVNVGNPHGVIFGPERDVPFAKKYGPGLEKKPSFPAGANIEFVHVLDNRTCQLVVWERGAGITLACGSGSVATACAGAAVGHFAFDQTIAVHQPGGTLHISVASHFSEIRQRGPATFVFKGEINI
jgi:diaminopimelate epimerase